MSKKNRKQEAYLLGGGTYIASMSIRTKPSCLKAMQKLKTLIEKGDITIVRAAREWVASQAHGPTATTPYSDGAPVLSHNRCPWRTLLDTRTHALEYIFEGTVGESPVTKVHDPKEQATVTTGCSEGPFDADDVVRAVEGLPNNKAGPNIVKNEDLRDSFFGQGQEGCSRPSEWMADHQPTVARKQSPDEVHLEANPAKSGPKDLRGPVRVSP